jgi:hypothetical protein
VINSERSNFKLFIGNFGVLANNLVEFIHADELVVRYQKYSIIAIFSLHPFYGLIQDILLIERSAVHACYSFCFEGKGNDHFILKIGLWLRFRFRMLIELGGLGSGGIVQFRWQFRAVPAEHAWFYALGLAKKLSDTFLGLLANQNPIIRV